MALVIDAHHHFWDPDNGDYGWMQGPAMEPIRQSFWPADLQPLLHASGVDKTVIVQTWSSVEETKHFLQIAADTDFVAGVVGWADLTDKALPDTLAQLKSGPGGEYLVGIRHQVHDEQDANWLLRDDVQHGLAAVEAAGLVYDLLTRPRELPAALEIVSNFPNLAFVVDHISKPEIANREFDNWHNLMQGFTTHQHVSCKLSGMVTEANWETWTPKDLEPYIKATIDIFGEDRTMYGSDWPVSLLAASYARVKEALESNLAQVSTATKDKIMGTNAARIYKLPI